MSCSYTFFGSPSLAKQDPEKNNRHQTFETAKEQKKDFKNFENIYLKDKGEFEHKFIFYQQKFHFLL